MFNQTKAKLCAGGTVFGTFLWSASETVTECIGYGGLDFVIIDAEHSPVDSEGAVNMLRAAKLKGISPFARVKDSSRSSILKLLDAGAEGIVVPCLKTVEEVRQVISYAKYHPVGERGFAFGRNPGYGFEPYSGEISEYFSVSNAETLLIPMCETAGFLENLEEIVAMEGVDGIFVGPYDLSVALGKPGVFNTVEFQQALECIVAACRKNGKPAFIFSNSLVTAKEHIALGYRGITLGIDVQILVQSYRRVIDEVKKNVRK